ncbi:hypothetical protein RU639_013839, partial [Aspergillus parasiticus]
KGARLSRA